MTRSDGPPDADRPAPPPTAAHRTAAGSIAPAYFERLYRVDPDPWAFDTSPYEAAKYAATLDALPRGRYAHAFEIGCANGALTARLAGRCDRVLAVDVAEAALARARERTAALRGVEVRRLAVPAEWPGDGPFDLVVVSEVGYYLALVHWTGETDYPLSADAVHGAFLADPAWRPARAGRTADYRLDVLERAG